MLFLSRLRAIPRNREREGVVQSRLGVQGCNREHGVVGALSLDDHLSLVVTEAVGDSAGGVPSYVLFSLPTDGIIGCQNHLASWLDDAS